MLSREDFYMIKQMRQQGAYIVDIATQIGCSERTVRRYLKYPEPPARKTRHKMVKLKPFMDYIDMRLAENVWNSEVIFAEIKAMGYTGGRSMLRYYIQPKRKMRPSKRTVRFETQPGYQLQHDWGEVEVEVAGQRCKVNFAVNTLGFSRRFHVFAAPKQDAEHTYESLVRAFRYFGGCVKTVLVDNQKAAVLKNNNGKVVFNSGFLLLADHNQSRNICSRYRIRTSIPVTSISAMCPGTAISRLVVIVTAFPKRCVVSRYRYEYRWMTSCGSTVMRNWWPHIASVRHRLAGRQCRSITPRSGSRSVRWNIDH